jgi:hypothetical protein
VEDRRTFLITYIDDQIKENEMGGECNTHEREVKCIHILQEKVKNRRLSKDLRVD